MDKAIALLTDGLDPAAVERRIAAEHHCSTRQARRYVHAYRRLARHHADRDALAVNEMLTILLKRSHEAASGPDPDWKACQKFLEQYSRMRGWMDKRSTVDVNISATVQHVAALDGLSPEALEALARFHQLAQRDREADAPQIVGAAGELASGMSSEKTTPHRGQEDASLSVALPHSSQ